MEAKRIAAERAVDYIQDGMIVGLGTGSTAYWAIQKLGMKVKEGLHVHAIATSNHTEELAGKFGIPLVTFSDIDAIDLTIDGADEVDRDFHLIKGGGGALLREKIVASASRQFIVVVDESKIVNRLGKFPLPVEIVRFGYEMTLRSLRKLGCRADMRMVDGREYVTDNGNYIADCSFGRIEDPQELHKRLNLIPGVVDNGLFVSMTRKVVVGYSNGHINELEKAF